MNIQTYDIVSISQLYHMLYDIKDIINCFMAAEYIVNKLLIVNMVHRNMNVDRICTLACMSVPIHDDLNGTPECLVSDALFSRTTQHTPTIFAYVVNN